ncbi:MAG TPA: ATP-binding cassette domain-containing protein, partial [Stellaceae bacterium]|nr:ATP-binding cassette domain-containing protein [Stellaceae bacterium]
KPGLTPRETLAFWAALRGVDVRRRAPLLDAALAAFALERVADWPCRWLSAGQRRRLALARLFVAPAPLWLLDEPFSALDRDNQMRLERAIEAHRATCGRIVLATHMPLEIGATASLVLDAFAPARGDVADG